VDDAAAGRQSLIYRRRWWTLAVLSLSVIIVVIDNSILNVALPTIQQKLHATNSELQWMVDAYILVMASLLFTMGAAGDRIGRAKALRIGLVVFAGGSIWAMTANSPDTLIAARTIMGSGAALIMPATLAVIVNVFPLQDRGKAIGIWASMAGVGIALGPILGGLLIEHFSWSSIFFINVPIVAIALTAGAFLIPDSRNPNPQGIDIVGTILSAGTLGLLVFGLIKGGNWGWSDTAVILCLGGAVIVGIVFVLWEGHTVKPMLDMSLFGNMRFSIGAAGITMMMMINFGIIFGLTLYMQVVQGYTALETGIRFLPMAVGFAVGSASSHRRVAAFGTKIIVDVGFIGIAALVAGASFWDVDMPYWILGLMFFGLAFCMGNIQAANVDAVTGAVPRAKAGVGSAMPGVAVQVGGAIGVAALGSVLSNEYASSLRPELEAIPNLPPSIIAVAEDSVGSAAQIAAQFPDSGERILTAAHNSFMDGWQLMALVACGIAVMAVIVVSSLMPARPLPPTEAKEVQ